MGCDCEPTGSGFGAESLKKQTFEASMSPSYKQGNSGGCKTNKGKFYDLTLEDFIVPNVGSETYVRVCDGSLWKAGQFIGIVLSANKIAAFKITSVGTGKLKILNGCDKSGDNGIVGNPEPGVTIVKDSILYAIPPTGCESGFADRIITALKTYGVDSVIEMIAESEDICFTSVKDISEEEEVHMFGGTMPDCECAPDAGWSSCLRKLKRIFTSQSGRSLCTPDAATISTAPVDGVPKRFALFDTNGCIKKGPTPQELRSCEGNTVISKDTPVEAVIVCKDGEYSSFIPIEENLVITTKKYEIPVEEGGGFEYKWVFQSSTNDYAVLKHTGSSGTAGGAATLGDWREKTLNVIAQQSVGFITLSGNKFTILKSGVFEIEWDCVFVNTADTQTRLDNSLDSAEQYLGTNPYPLSGNGTTSSGFAVVTVPSGETKQYNLMYRVGFTGTQGDAIPWGVPVWSILKIRRIA